MPGQNGHGGARRHAGRPPNSIRAAADRKALALAASEYTLEALEVMVKLMRKSKIDTVKLMAADRILDRAVGRAPMQIDVGALRHDEIVYQTAAEVRAELERRGVPLLLIEHSSDAEIESPPRPCADADRCRRVAPR